MNLYLKRLFVTRLRKTLVAALVIIVALSVVAYAYWRSLPSQTGPIVTLTSPPIELSLLLDKTDQVISSNMSVHFSLRNISNMTITLTWPNWPWRPVGTDEGKYWLTTTAEGIAMYDDTLLYQGLQFGYILTSSNGTIIEDNPSDYIIIPSSYDITFEPNASINQTLTIDLLQYRDQMHHPIQQGTYQISATLHAYLNEGGNFTGPLTWETPSITFTLGAYMRRASLPSPTGPKVTLTSSPLELSMALDKTAYPLDDNMTISFYLRNISNETITATIPDITGVSPNDPAITLATVSEGVNTSFNEPGEDPFGGLFPFRYTFVASNGTIIYEFPSTGLPETYSIVFEPGASLNQTLYVNLTKYSEIRTAPIGHPLQKGAYQVTGAFEAGLNDKGLYTWETPSITFTLDAYMFGASLPSPAGPKVTLTSSPLELSMSLDKIAYLLTDNMSISFYLRNINNETVTLTWPNWPWRPESNLEGEGKFWLTTTAEGVTMYDDTLLYQGLQFGYILTDSNGTVVEDNPRDYIIIPSSYDITFEPNASINQTLTIDLLQYRDQMHHPVQQGTYQISARLQAFLSEGGNFTGLLTWETPSITFTIR